MNFLLLIPIALSLSAPATLAQIPGEADKLLQLGRDSVIRLAIARLRESGFADIDPGQFDRLTVQTDGREVKVNFDRSVQYCPMNTFVVHTASVRLVEGAVGWIPVGEQADSSAPLVMYEYTDADRKVIDMILGAQDWQRREMALVIAEEEDSFLITEASSGGETIYRWDKLTGTISEEGHGDYALDDFDDGFREVDWEKIKSSNK